MMMVVSFSPSTISLRMSLYKAWLNNNALLLPLFSRLFFVSLKSLNFPKVLRNRLECDEISPSLNLRPIFLQFEALKASLIELVCTDYVDGPLNVLS